MQKKNWRESKNYIERFPSHIANELDETDDTARTAANFASDIVGRRRCWNTKYGLK